jgi:dTDP-4-dehydrorhamnose reductase
MKILVTGRAGQLVSSLVERAQHDPDVSLVALGRPELDLERPGAAADAIADSSPDLVINAAAFTAVDAAEDDPERAFRINADAAGEIAAAARAAGVPIVHVSTDYVFDGASAAPYREDDPVAPIGVYGRSKLAGEEQVRAANPDHLIVRTAWVYSPFGRNFVRTMMAAAREREELRVVADQRGNPTNALDLADALLAIARRWQGGTIHLAGTGAASWFEFASAIMAECALLGVPAARIVPIATADWPTRAQRPQDSTLDCGRAASLFGVHMPGWRESLPAVVARLAQG